MMLHLAFLGTLVAAASAISWSPDALVRIVPGGNPRVSGTIYLTRHPLGVMILGTLWGLTPGFHGFHIHENGNTGNLCVAAGGHFNALQQTHGGPLDPQRHVGDLGNIVANGRGVAQINILDTLISLDPSSPVYVGNLAVVIHAGRDDLGRGGNEESLATGNAGDRDACGIIYIIEKSWEA